MSTNTAKARQLFRRLVTIYVLGSLVATIIGVVLFSAGLDLSPEQQRIAALDSLVAFIPMIGVDIWLISRHYRPIRRFYETFSSPAEALSRALNLPTYSALRVFLVHTPSYIVVVMAGSFITIALTDFTMSDWQLALIPVFVLFGGVGHGIFEYFAVARTMGPVVDDLWQHLDASSTAEIAEFIPVSLRRKLLFVSVFVVLVPLLALGITSLFKVSNLLSVLGVASIGQQLQPLIVWTVVVALLTTIIMTLMSLAMAGQITQNAQKMLQGMSEIEAGTFDVRLRSNTTDEYIQLYDGFNQMAQGLHERERLHDAFGRYVAPELAEQVLSQGVNLGGNIIEGSVLFADIRDFTALSERTSAQAVVGLLNRYFAAVEPAIHQHNGWIDKFGGDSLMAVFGAPVPMTDHARRAVEAALSMRQALAVFNQEQRNRSEPELRIGVGIACGEMVAGNIGSPDRMEYTVIGDVVNLASRIEALTKQWSTDILIAADVRHLVQHDITAKAMPPVNVQGKSEPIQVYAVL